MRIRFLGGLMAAVGIAGGVTAQTPNAPFTYLNADKPAARLGGVRAIRTPMAGETLIPVSMQDGPKSLPDAKSGVVPATPGAPSAAAPSTPASNVLTQGCSVGTSCPTYACDPCGPCGPCGPAGRFWVAAEYLFWTTSGNRVPPLVTTAPDGTPRQTAGVIGQPTTTILYGGNRINDDWRSGFRVRAGMWFDECQTCGIEGDGFFLGQSRDQATFASNGNGTPIITRPFFNADPNVNANDTQLVSYPNVLAGSVSVNSTSNLWGASGNMMKNICCDPCGRLDFLFGYRYLNLSDDLRINEDLTALGGEANRLVTVAPGTRFQIEDRFRTDNQIHAPFVGLQWERRFSHYFLNVRSQIGLGWNRQTTEISGSTVITPPGGPSTTYAGGLLAQPTNIGRYTSNKFVVVPSGQVRLGVQVTERLRAYVGYDFLYVSSVVRSGDQIDVRVNPAQLAPSQGLGNGPAVPAYTGKRTDFWAHGANIGLEFRF